MEHARPALRDDGGAGDGDIAAARLFFFDEQSGKAERGDGEASSIKEVTDPIPSPSPAWEGSAAEWYTLDGRKLQSKPTAKGLYIHNGRKVVIK